MSEIKLVLTDIDGTVAQLGKHLVSNVVREAVIRCEESGILVVPVTGRYHRMAQPVLELLGFDGPGVFDNGATIQDCKTGEIIWSRWMNPEQVRKIAKICLPVAYDIDYMDDHIQHQPAADEIELIEDMNRPAPYVYALIDEHGIASVEKALDLIPGITYYTASSTNQKWPNAIGIQVNTIDADKFHGVSALRGILGISKEHTFAIGDGKNDLALFSNAEHTVAMDNADDSLKAVADHIVPSVDEDGFAVAMDLYVLYK